MSISPQILRHASALDPQQLDVVGHLEGPLLVRAGPGAGKTRVLVWRLVNLLLQDVCGPDEIVLLAFGTLAAAEMRQRVAAAARSVGYRGDVDRIQISTIHAMSHRILSAHHRRVGLKSGYAVLNREERQGFLNENFDSIFGSRERSLARLRLEETAADPRQRRPVFRPHHRRGHPARTTGWIQETRTTS